MPQDPGTQQMTLAEALERQMAGEPIEILNDPDFGALTEKTFGDAISEIDATKLPVAGMFFDAKNLLDLYNAASAAETRDLTPEEFRALWRWSREQNRPTSLGYDVASVLTEMPAFAIETLLGGAVAGRVAAKTGMKAASVGVKRAVRAAVDSMTEAGVARMVGRGAINLGEKAAAALGTSAVTTALMPGRIAASAAERTLAEHVGIDGERAQLVLSGSIPSFLDALPEGALDTWIENFSERSGGMIPLPNAIRALQARVIGEATRRVPGMTAGKILSEIARGAGWDGVLAEMGEERVGDILRAALLDDPWENVIPSGRQLLTEAIAFSVPGAVSTGIQKVAGAAGAPVEVGENAKLQQSERGDEITVDDETARLGREFAAAGGADPAGPVRFHAMPDWMQDLARDVGANVVGVDTGAPLERASGEYRNGTIFIDVNQPAERQLDEVFLHEVGHHLRAASGADWRELAQRLRTIDPEGLDRLREERRGRQFGGRADASLSERERDLLGEETVSTYMEDVAGMLRLALERRSTLARIAERQPSLARSIGRGVVRMLNSVGYRLQMPEALQMAQDLHATLARTETEKRLSPGAAIRVAQEIAAAISGLRSAVLANREAQFYADLEAAPAQEQAQVEQQGAAATQAGIEAQMEAAQPAQAEVPSETVREREARGRDTTLAALAAQEAALEAQAEPSQEVQPSARVQEARAREGTRAAMDAVEAAAQERPEAPVGREVEQRAREGSAAGMAAQEAARLDREPWAARYRNLGVKDLRRLRTRAVTAEAAKAEAVLGRQRGRELTLLRAQVRGGVGSTGERYGVDSRAGARLEKFMRGLTATERARLEMQDVPQVDEIDRVLEVLGSTRRPPTLNASRREREARERQREVQQMLREEPRRYALPRNRAKVVDLPDGTFGVEIDGKVVRTHNARNFAEVDARTVRQVYAVDPELQQQIDAAPTSFQSITPANARKLVRLPPLTQAEKEMLAAANAPPEVERYIRDVRAQFPASEGWMPMEVAKIVPGDTPASMVQWRGISPTYHNNKGISRKGAIQRLRRGIVAEVRSIIDQARGGDVNSLVILRNAKWYSNMTEALYREWGGFAPTFADLLGALSPNTPVQTNYDFALEAIRNFSAGKYSNELRSLAQHLASGKDAGSYDGPLILRGGKQYGINSRNAMLAMLDVWMSNVSRHGSAPKARNFGGNLIGRFDSPTVDVWAARTAQRLMGHKRIPPMADGGVGGSFLVGGDVGSSYGFMGEALVMAGNDLGMNAPDLQAVLWFSEKRLWTEKGWTNEAGQGGSFEEVSRETDAMRSFAGISVQRDAPPSPTLKMLTEGELIANLTNDPDVLAWRAPDTRGEFWDPTKAPVEITQEHSFDHEVVHTRGWNSESWINGLKDIASREGQTSFLTATVIPTADALPTDAPGLEVYLRDPVPEGHPLLERLREIVTQGGMTGWTMIRAQRLDMLDPPLPNQYIGIRSLYVHEYVGAEGSDRAAEHEKALPGILQAESSIQAIDEVASAATRAYRTNVYFKGRDYEDRSRVDAQAPRGVQEESEQQAREGDAGSGAGAEADGGRDLDVRDLAEDDAIFAAAERGDEETVRRLALPRTRTPQFRAWFGDSKVVDADGNPLVVYRGGKEHTNVWNTKENRSLLPNEHLGVHFSLDPATASLFAGDDGSVGAYFLSISNPLRLPDTGTDWGSHSVLNALKSLGEKATPEQRRFMEALDGNMYEAEENNLGDDRKVLADTLSELGYDGVVYLNRKEGVRPGESAIRASDWAKMFDFAGRAAEGVTDEMFLELQPWMRDAYIALEPNQIKSATGNRGTFRRDAADVRLALPRIDSRRLERARGTIGDAIAEGRGLEGGRAEGDYANRATGEKTRGFAAGIADLREQGLDPVTIDEQVERAEKMLSDNPEGVRAEIINKLSNGTALLPHEQLIAERVRNEVALGALRNRSDESMKRAIKIGWAYQEMRAQTARALGVVRDAFLRLRDPQAIIGDALAEPSRKNRRRIQKIRKELASKPTEQRRFALQRELDQLLEEESRIATRALARLDRSGLTTPTPEQFSDPVIHSRIARIIASAKADGWDYLLEYRLAAMLGGPLTHVANFAGNQTHQFYEQVAKRVAEAMTNLVVRDPNAATFGEVATWFRAWVGGLAQAGHNAMLAFRTEAPVFERDLLRRGIDVKEAGSKVDLEGGDAPRIPGAVGRVLRAPSLTMLKAMDEFFITLAATTEATALAYRQAKGNPEEMRRILADPMNNVHLDGLKMAKKVTFQDGSQSPTANMLLAARRSVDEQFHAPIGSILLPFVRTPLQIFKAGLGIPFHPMTTAWRLVRGEYRGQNHLLVRDAGASMMSMGIALALINAMRPDGDDEPLITGSGSIKPGERDLQMRTRPPMSVRVGDTWYSYTRVEPFSVAFATTIDLAQAASDAAAAGNQEAFERTFLRLVGSIGDQINDKTFLRTVGDVYKLATQPDASSGARFVRDTLVTSFIPNVIRQPARAMDETMRVNAARRHEGEGVWAATWADMGYQAFPTPGNAPPMKYDLWGREIPRGGGWFPARLLSPMQETGRVSNVSRIDRMLATWNDMVEAGEVVGDKFEPAPPRYNGSRRKQEYIFSDEEYSRLLREAGQESARALEAKNLNIESPTQDDIDTVKRVIESARARAVNRILNDRRSAR
jgi:hypothetical protein